jgi:hypothetical protein
MRKLEQEEQDMVQQKAKPKYDMPYNPWRVLEQQRAYAADPWSYRIEKQMIRREYQGCQEPEPCECGKKRYWRNTVGVMMCPDCRRMRVRTPEGDKIIVGSGFTPEWQE